MAISEEARLNNLLVAAAEIFSPCLGILGFPTDEILDSDPVRRE
jgi:hypothetical protein